MKEKIEHIGWWFLPSNPDKKTTGKVTFAPNEKIQLELIGCFYSEEELISRLSESSNTAIIHGITSDAQEITLINSSSSVSWNQSAPSPVTIYNCDYMIQGALLTDINEKCFSRIEIDIAELNTWLPFNVLEHSIQSDEAGAVKEIKASLLPEKAFKTSTDIDNDTKLTLTKGGRYSATEQFNTITFSQTTSCKIENIKDKSAFYTLYTKAELFREFLSLATVSPATYTSITLYDNDHYEDTQGDQKHCVPINLYYIEHELSKKVKDINFLFKYTDIKDDFPSIIKEWYQKASEIAPIRRHLIKSIHPKQIFDSLDFLIIAQALDGYHKRFIQTKGKLEQRINEVITSFPDIDRIQKTNFDTQSIADSRNYYSHFYTKGSSQKILEGVDLYLLTKDLRLLLICCVLRVIGFENKKINEILNKCNNTSIIPS
jgi:hypothetical protein